MEMYKKKIVGFVEVEFSVTNDIGTKQVCSDHDVVVI